MDAPRTPREPFRFRDPRQQQIYQRLLLIGPGPAAYFRDACRIVEGNSNLDAASHIVAHLLREVESAMRDVLESIMPPSPVGDEQPCSSSSGHKSEIRALLKVLDMPHTDPIAKAWLDLAGREDTTLHGRAHRRHLAAPRPIDDEFRRFWTDIQAILAAVLDRFESRFLDVIPILDELKAKPAPTHKDAQRLKNHVPHNRVTLAYFFQDLDNPAWLSPLHAEGFFQHPPEAERDEDGNLFFPAWPPSGYLARMAHHQAEDVVSIALDMAPTENVYVHEDMADVALAVPAELAVRLVPVARQWLEGPARAFVMPEKMANLVVKLAEARKENDALDLAAVLLEVLPETSPSSDPSGRSSVLGPSPRVRFDQHEYDDIAHQCTSALVSGAGARALEFFANLLERAIQYSMPDGNGKKPIDYSYTWCSRIRTAGGDRPGDLRSILVRSVRDAAEQLVREQRAPITDVVKVLASRTWHSFQRIVLHLLALFPEESCELAANHLLDPSLFDEFQLQPEYALLQEAFFGCLSLDHQNVILAWIDKGPDRKAYRAGRKRWDGTVPTDEEVNEYCERWRRDQMRPIRDALPAEWNARYRSLVERFGEAEYPPVNIHVSGGFVGDSSPKSLDDLKGMTNEQLIAFLQTWEPSAEPSRHSLRGLATTLTNLATSTPGRFATAALQFGVVGPAYVAAILSGLRDAAKTQWDAPWWPPVLELCQTVVDQPGASDPANQPDNGWRWARQVIAGLLTAGLSEDRARLPIDVRNAVWSILEPLSEDPEPAPDYEVMRGDGEHFDPVMTSINTVRGEAMHAIIRYALWVRRWIETLPDAGSRIKRGFDEMSEVRRVLDRHLDPAVDASPAIRAVYGQWFPQLCLLDERWAAEKKGSIFTAAPADNKLWLAAWSSYIIWCRAYHDVFRLIESEYARALDELGRLPRSVSGGNPDEHLAEHLMVFYWQGFLSLDDQNGLVAQFFAKAGPTLRSHAVEFVGRALMNGNRDVPAPVLERLMALWQHRLRIANTNGDAGHKEKLASFGWWFASEKFEDRWAIDMLKKTIEIGGWAEPDHMVVEHLAKLAERYPLPAVECLALLVHGDKKGWGIAHWHDHAREIMTAALRSSDEAAQRAAADLINRLAARGILGFRDLLGED